MWTDRLTGYQQEPRRPDHQVDQDTRRGVDGAPFVEVPLRQIPAADKEQVRARGLWGERREVVGREQELKREQRRRHAELYTDAEKDCEQGEQMGGLA